MANQVAITGNTYPVKESLKALGARWNREQKAWMISADKADQARQIVAGSATPKSKSSRPHYSTCHDCGIASRGYYYCYDCAIEHRDGGSKAHGGMSYRDRNGRFVLGDED